MNNATVITKLNVKQFKRDKKLRGLGVFYEADTAYLYFHSSLDDNTTFRIATSTDGRSFQIDQRALHINTGTTTFEDISCIINCSIAP